MNEDELIKKQEKYILAIVREAKRGKIKVDTTKIMKIMFLLQREYGLDLGLKFTPFVRGPTSMVVVKLIEKLVENGIIRESARPIRDPFTGWIIAYYRTYRLKKKVRIRINRKEREFIKNLAKQESNELVKYVMRKYPEDSIPERVRDISIKLMNMLDKIPTT